MAQPPAAAARHDIDVAPSLLAFLEIEEAPGILLDNLPGFAIGGLRSLSRSIRDTLDTCVRSLEIEPRALQQTIMELR